MTITAKIVVALAVTTGTGSATFIIIFCVMTRRSGASAMSSPSAAVLFAVTTARSVFVVVRGFVLATATVSGITVLGSTTRRWDFFFCFFFVFGVLSCFAIVVVVFARLAAFLASAVFV